ncbi:hypothetical protein BDV93DRAFT_528370 [Ceratobasidium sp. AG-I]|nr:hypothetical protein BDV93DRAFT_528370 [Ceratobasidium sp. AG-I]
MLNVLSRTLKVRLGFVVATLIFQFVGSQVPVFDSSHLLQHERPPDNPRLHESRVELNNQSLTNVVSGLDSLAGSLVRKKPSDLLIEAPSLIPSAGLRWDALYYHDVALRGTYLFEQQYAFSPGVPIILRLVDLAKRNLLYLIQPLEKAGSSSLWAKPLVDWLLFVTKVTLLGLLACEPCLELYRLTKSVTLSDDFALLAMMVQVLMGAPPVMFRSAYAEPFFAWSSFKGMRACHNRRYFPGALYFALATSFRTNGILLSGFILYDLIARPVLTETISSLSSATRTTLFSAFKPFLRATRRISPFDTAYSLLLTFLVIAPSAAHQFMAYATFCIEPTTTATESLYPRPWCASRLPMIYGFVQSYYWDVGFLRYWTVAQIPNFIIAAPMLVLVGGSSAWFLWLGTGVFGKRIGDGDRVDHHKSDPAVSCLLSPAVVLTLLPYALHALALSTLLFTSAHVQIALRVLPAATPWAVWAGAALIIKGTHTDQAKKWYAVDRSSDEGEPTKLDGKAESGGLFVASRVGKEVSRSWWPFTSHLWIGWSIIWVFVSSVLWLSFLPPA